MKDYIIELLEKSFAIAIGMFIAKWLGVLK